MLWPCFNIIDIGFYTLSEYLAFLKQTVEIESESDEDEDLTKESLLSQLAEAQTQQREKLAYEQLTAGGMS